MNWVQKLVGKTKTKYLLRTSFQTDGEDGAQRAGVRETKTAQLRKEDEDS